MSRSPVWPIWLIILSLIVIFLAPALLPDGMFMDGLIYAAVAKNLAHGVGTFWFPHFSETTMSPFHEHPPLALGLEAIFFKWLGDSRWTERIFSLIEGVILAILLGALWTHSAPSIARRTRWLPLFFLFTVPLVYWSIANNMLENAVAVFCTLAVWLCVRAPLGPGRPMWLFGSGVAVLLGLLSKGPVALFVLAVPVFLPLHHESGWRRAVLDELWMAMGVCAPLALVLAFSTNALASLTTYFQVQILNSLYNVRTVDSRWYILVRLWKETYPMVCLAVCATAWSWHRRRLRLVTLYWRPALFYLLVGLAASVPFTIGMKQRGFYLVPSFPFFALSWSLWIAAQVDLWLSVLRPRDRLTRFLTWAGYTLALASLIVVTLQVGRVGRDRAALEAVYATVKRIPDRGRINICPSGSDNWSLHGYFARYAFISLERSEGVLHDYFLSDGSCRLAGFDDPPIWKSDAFPWALYARSDRAGAPAMFSEP